MRLGVVFVTVGAIFTVACGRSGDPAVVASGHVEATEVRLAAKIAGRIEALPVEEGTVVSAGQEVGRIETTDTRLLLAQVGAERDQAAAELRLRESGARTEDKDELRARVAALVGELDGARKELERMQGLLDRGSGTEKSRDDAKARRDSLAGRLAAARAALARAEAGFRREEIEAARARLAAVEARIGQLEQQIADASLKSPLDGVVTEKLAEPGEWALSGTALLVLTDLGRPWLTVYVSGPDLPRLRLGQRTEVVTDDGEAREGRITFIASKAEFTPKNVQTREERAKLVYKIKIGLDNSDGAFKPGMPAEARLAIEEAR